jgi:multiple sugar transport system substrate-binding protein
VYFTVFREVSLVKYGFLSRLITLCIIIFVSGHCYAQKVTVGVLSNSGVQRAIYTSFVKEFEQENPDIQIELLIRADAEYKEQLAEWFANKNGPDLLNWQGGERLYQYVREGKIAAIDDFWQQNNLASQFSQAAIGAVSLDGRHYAVPISYYQWGLYYRESLFEKLSLQAPTNWQEFLEVCAVLKEQNITPITIGAKYKWPTSAWFDYLNLRVNGLEFHQSLLSGKVPFTDDRVRQVFLKWKELLDKEYFVQRYNGWNWQQAMPFMYHKLAGMTLIGNFFAGVMPPTIKDDFKFFRFPIINPQLPIYEEAPLDLFMVPSYAKHNVAAQKFLLFLASKRFQEEFNEKLGMISPNIQTNSSSDYFIQAGTKTLNRAVGVSQFFDRDTNAGMADVATVVFTEFMDDKNIDKALERLESARQEHLL